MIPVNLVKISQTFHVRGPRERSFFAAVVRKRIVSKRRFTCNVCEIDSKYPVLLSISKIE